MFEIKRQFLTINEIKGLVMWLLVQGAVQDQELEETWCVCSSGLGEASQGITEPKWLFFQK